MASIPSSLFQRSLLLLTQRQKPLCLDKLKLATNWRNNTIYHLYSYHLERDKGWNNRYIHVYVRIYPRYILGYATFDSFFFHVIFSILISGSRWCTMTNKKTVTSVFLFSAGLERPAKALKENNRTIVTRLVRVIHARIFSSFSRFRFTRDEKKRSFPQP